MRILQGGADSQNEAAWRAELEESKIDMGLIDPLASYIGPSPTEAMRKAVMEDNAFVVKSLVTRGADASAIAEEDSGSTLLHVSAMRGHLRTVTALLQGGADPLAKDREGCTPRQRVVSDRAASGLKAVLKLWEGRKVNDVAPAVETVVRKTAS
ncbi:MAG: hypothetical protein OXT65_00070 [Alphaproteobacteria bacterium]|nr:hypothetical protein [Alphaproteobacteria bacterium]